MQCIRGKKNKADTGLRINLCSLLGELQLWINNTPAPCICMCENPSAWVGFTCGGQSPLRRVHSSASEKQIARHWIHSLFGQLHGASCPTPKLGSDLLVHLSFCSLMLSRQDLKDFLLYSACRRSFPLHLQNFCLYFLLEVIVQNGCDFTNTLQSISLISLLPY